MLFSEENVKAAVRNRDGKRVFFLSSGDTLTPSARDWLQQERIAVLPAQQAKPEVYRLENGAIFPQKPEDHTHLRDNILVPKTHPVIAFRGAMDSLQAQLLLTQAAVPEKIAGDVAQILQLSRQILRCDVMQEPLELETLCGLSLSDLRRHSHDPAHYYGVPHFMPSSADGQGMLQLNLARCAARNAELAAAHAFHGSRTDLVQALNRMSSMLYILMIRLKAQGKKGSVV